MSSLRLHLGASEDGASVRVYRALFGLLLAAAMQWIEFSTTTQTSINFVFHSFLPKALLFTFCVVYSHLFCFAHQHN